MADPQVEVRQAPPIPPTQERLYATPPPDTGTTAESEREEVLKLFGFSFGPDAPLPEIPSAAPATDPAAPPADPVPHGTTPPGNQDPASGSPAPIPGSPPTAPTPPPGTTTAATPPAGNQTPPATPPTPPSAREPRKLDRNAAAIAEKAIKEAAERLQNAQPPAAPAPGTPPPAATPPADPKLDTRIEALKTLQKDPTYANRDLVGEYSGYLKKLATYEEGWIKAHPDEEFDLESSDHEAWREKNEPEIDEDDIRDAEVAVKTLRAVEAKLEAREQERAEKTFGEVVLNRAAEDAEKAAGVVMSFLGDGKQYKTLEELEDADVLASTVAQVYLPKTVKVAQAITELLTPGSPVRFDATNEFHRIVAQQVRTYEDQVMSLPPEQRLDHEGRRYVPDAEYVRLSPVERAKTWTFRYAPDELRGLVALEIRNIAKRDYERKKAKASGSSTPPPAPAAPAATPMPRPPSGGSGPGTVPPAPTQTTRSGSFWNEG